MRKSHLLPPHPRPGMSKKSRKGYVQNQRHDAMVTHNRLPNKGGWYGYANILA
jgi:hypothetical protein